MLREYTQLVSETIDDGFERGISLFMENLEADLAKSEVISEAGNVDNVLKAMFEGYTNEQLDEQEATDDEVDSLLQNLKKEGLID